MKLQFILSNRNLSIKSRFFMTWTIWKNKCLFDKVNVDLKKMLIWKNKCQFEKTNVDLKK